MRSFGSRVAAGILLAGLFVAPSIAQAKGVAIFNTGEDIFESGELPAELTQGKEAAGWKAGYKCQVFGIFWAYVHWWDCEPVAFQGDTYDNSPEVAKAVAAKYQPGDVQMGAWQKHGRWAFAALILFGIIGGIVGKLRG